MDGYCPLEANLGSHGFCLQLALRPDVHHPAAESDFNLERAIPIAQSLSAASPKAPNLARLDWGKFDTIYPVSQRAALAMNILRLIDQRATFGPDAPVRHSAKWRRIKTVTHDLIYRAGRMILGLGANDRAAKAFVRMHGKLFAVCT